MRRLRSPRSQTSFVFRPVFLLRRVLGIQTRLGNLGAGLDRYSSWKVPNRWYPGGSGLSERRPITYSWRIAAQTVEPQLIAATALIGNYTFGRGTHFSTLGCL
jgi:hypothetical protein